MNESTQPSPRSEQSAATIVMQELTYALWEWVVITIGGILSTCLSYFFVDHDSQHDFIIYGVAAMICLTPVAVALDYFYRKREPLEHHGFGAVVFVINAVLVFLSTIGGLIGAVIATLTLIVDSGAKTDKEIALIVTLVFAVLNAMLFIRIIGAKFTHGFAKIFAITMSVLAVVALVLAILGPIGKTFTSRDDRAIEDNLSSIDQAISEYNTNNGELPTSLDQLSFDEYSSGAKELVSDHKVTYVQSDSTPGTSSLLSYKLCVTYKDEKGDGSVDKNNYSIDTSNHPSGYTCYTRTQDRMVTPDTSN